MGAATISAGVRAFFERYALGPLLASICPELPWPLKAAVVTVESGGDVSIFNFYDPHCVLHVGHWDGTTPPTPNTYANSLLQILTKYPRDLSKPEMFIPAKACAAIFPELMRFRRWAYDAGLRGSDLDAATYAGHNRGAGNQKAAAARCKVPTIEAWVASFPYMPDAAKTRSIAVYKHVADLVAAWELVQARFVVAPASAVAPIEDWHTLASWPEDDALCTLDPMYPGGTPQCIPDDLLVCLPDDGEMSYAAAPEDLT